MRPGRFGLRLRWWCLFSLVNPTAAWAVGQETGRIIGTVTEAQTKIPVPGATVKVSGPALIGPPIHTTTDEDGKFEVQNLLPGDYDVEVSYAGVKPIVQRVLVQPSAATPLQIRWSAEMTQAETTVVEEQRHLTRPDTSNTGAVFSMEKQNDLAVNRRYQDVVTQAPGVTQNTGNPNVKGARTSQNRVYIDGLDTNDPVTNTFSVNIQQDSVASVQVITGAMEAKYNSLGSIINLITKSGSDEFHVDAAVYAQHNKLQTFDVGGAQVYDGPRPFSEAPQPPSKTYLYNLSVNGPIIKHALWYSLGLEHRYISQVQPPGPPLFRQAPNLVRKDIYARAKLTWAPSGRHRFMLEALGDPTTIDYENNNSSTANSDTPLASVGRFQGGWKAIGEWDYFISDAVNAKLYAGYSINVLNVGPQGKVREIDPKYGIYDFNRSRHLNNDDGTAWFNTISGTLTQRHRIQLDASFAFRGRLLGSHDAEMGVQSAFLRQHDSTRYTGGGIRYVDRNNPPIPLDGGFCDMDPALGVAQPTGRGCFERRQQNDYVSNPHGFTIGFYVQDRWKPTGRLTLLPGIRWDISRTTDTDGDRQSVYGWGPRFSVLYDLTGDQKTIAQVSYGRSTTMLYLSSIAGVINTRRSRQTIYVWSSARGQFEPAASGAAPSTAILDREHHTPPHDDEITLSLRREVFHNSVLVVDYTYKKISNILDSVETNQIFDPSGNRVIGFLDPRYTTIFLNTFDPRNYDKYSGFDLIFESRPTPNLDFNGSYTLSWTWGPASGDNQFGNPRQSQMFTGFVSGVDTRHAFKTQTTYQFLGIHTGLVVNWRSGIALRKSFQSNSLVPTRYRSPIGTEPGTPINDVRSWTEFRTPDFFSVSLHVGYDLFDLIQQHLLLSVDIENLLNNFTAGSIIQGDGPNFGQASARPNPLRVQLGVRYRY